jgi:predicted transcriptional regulator
MVQSDANDKLRLDQSNESKLRIQDGTVKPSAMALVIKYLLVRPHTSTSLVQKIGVYSQSHINYCLRKLRKAELIDAVWNSKQVSLVYYNLNLEKVDSPN